MEINKAKQKKKLQKIIPLAMAAVLTMQGTNVTVYGSVAVNKGVKSVYQVTPKTVVADVTTKNLQLTAGQNLKITATGYTIGNGSEQSYTGDYTLTTNGNPVADANIEIIGNANVTLKNCHLTSTSNTSSTNKGLFSFSGGNVNLKLVGTNSISYTGTEDTYTIGSKTVNEDLTVSGDGSLYLKNVSLRTEASKIGIEDSKIYCNKTIKAVGELKLTGKSVLAVDALDLDNASDKLILNGDSVVYFKTAVAGGVFAQELKKGVLYTGTTITLNADYSVKLENGVGIIGGNPNIPELNRPSDSQLWVEINKDDVVVKDVEYTGRDAEPEITVKVNRHIVGEKILTKNEDYTVEITDSNKSGVGEKHIKIKSKQNKGYTGEVTKTFNVTPKDIKTAEVSVNLAAWDYTGEEKTITVDAVTLGGITLNAGTDYTVTGNKATNAGEHTLKIEGTGNYGGKIEKNWKINKATLAISEAAIAPKTYNGKTDATVTVVTLAGIKANTLTKGTDYDVTGVFSDKNVGKGKTVIVKLTLKDTDKAKNYELTKDTLMLTGQEIKKGKHQKPPIAGTVYVDENDPDNKFMYSVGIVKGAEYQIGGAVVGNPDESKWQDSNIFKGIEPNSTHVFYIRMKASEGMDASEPDNKTVTFNKIANTNKPNLQYKITDGTTANTKKITLTTEAGVEYSFDGGASYEITGIKDNLPAGTPVQLWARFKATNTRNASSETKQTVDVSKNTYNAPAPILEEGTYYVDPSNEDKFEYKVKTVGTAPAGKTYEYSKDLMTWITPTAIDGTVTFGAIEPKSTVTFYARIKAEGGDGAGIQGSRKVTFKRLKRVDKPVLVATVGGIKGNKTVTISAVVGAQYKFGEESWQLGNVKHHITDEKIIVGIRFGETKTYETSEPVFKEIVLNETNGYTGGGNGDVVPLPSTEDKKPEAGKDEKKSDMDKDNNKSDTSKDGNMADKTKPVAKVAAESVSKNKAEANVSSDDIKEALEAAKESEKNIVRLKVTAPKGIKSVDVKLEEGVLGSLIDSAIKAFEVTANKVKVQFENKALALIDKKSKGDVALSIASVTKLSTAEKKIAGKRPVYNISLKAGETKITNLGEGKVKISIPYNKPVSEKASGLYATYLNKKGEAVRIKASYNAKNKTLTFSTKYLAKYIIGYKAPKKNK